jgi:hypothetical protein
MVPRGGIELSSIQLKVHHFMNGDLPVYLPVDPALYSRPAGCDSVPPYTSCVSVTRYMGRPLARSQGDADQGRCASHRSSGVVNVAQFNPWQAHAIVVDACASRAGSGSIFSGYRRAALLISKISTAAFEAMSRPRSLPYEKRNLRCGIRVSKPRSFLPPPSRPPGCPL